MRLKYVYSALFGIDDDPRGDKGAMIFKLNFS